MQYAPNLLNDDLGSSNFSPTRSQRAVPPDIDGVRPVSAGVRNFATREGSVDEDIFNNLAALKVQTSELAMHLRRNDRDSIFAEIDYLLDPAEFDTKEDCLIDNGAFRSYLRFLTYSPQARPATLGVGAGGEVIAVWIGDNNANKRTLSVEFMADDHVKCSFIHVTDQQQILEAASYIGAIKRLDDVLQPYNVDDLYKRDSK